MELNNQEKWEKVLGIQTYSHYWDQNINRKKIPNSTKTTIP